MTGCRALIFDVDGTLADTEEVHRRAFNRAFPEFGLDWQWDVPLYGELLNVTGGKERIVHYMESLPLPDPERERVRALVPGIHRRKTRLYRDMVERGEAPVRPGVARLIREALEAGVLVAIASTTSPENVEPLITAGFGPQAMGWFAAIATGDVVANKKPAPDIYNVALRMLRLSAADAVAIEDSAIGVRSAKAAGLFTVATPNIWTRTQDFTAADLLLQSLGDPEDPLSAADHRRLGARSLSFQRLAALHAAAQLEDIPHAKAH